MANTKKIPNDKLERLELLAFENCLRLHQDAIMLFKSGSYSSAYFLSVIALEEMGKVLWIDFTIFQTRVSDMDRDGQELFLKSIFQHSHKQGIFVHELGSDQPPISKMLKDNTLETKKQNSLYVGLPKKGKNINWDGKIIVPRMVSINAVSKQITILNDALLELILGCIKRTTSVDGKLLFNSMDQKMYYRLMINWEHMSKRTNSRLKKLEAIGEDFEDG
jgi:AbiV family abortive infection protein